MFKVKMKALSGIKNMPIWRDYNAIIVSATATVLIIKFKSFVCSKQ